MKTTEEINNALEYIKSKHNGEIPYQYGKNECAKLMADYAEHYHENKKLSKQEAERKVSMLLAAFLTYVDENGRDGSWPGKCMAKRSLDEKKEELTTLLTK